MSPSRMSPRLSNVPSCLSRLLAVACLSAGFAPQVTIAQTSIRVEGPLAPGQYLPGETYDFQFFLHAEREPIGPLVNWGIDLDTPGSESLIFGTFTQVVSPVDPTIIFAEFWDIQHNEAVFSPSEFPVFVHDPLPTHRPPGLAGPENNGHGVIGWSVFLGALLVDLGPPPQDVLLATVPVTLAPDATPETSIIGLGPRSQVQWWVAPGPGGSEVEKFDNQSHELGVDLIGSALVVPEPTTGLLLLVGMLRALSRRRPLAAQAARRSTRVGR